MAQKGLCFNTPDQATRFTVRNSFHKFGPQRIYFRSQRLKINRNEALSSDKNRQPANPPKNVRLSCALKLKVPVKTFQSDRLRTFQTLPRFQSPKADHPKAGQVSKSASEPSTWKMQKMRKFSCAPDQKQKNKGLRDFRRFAKVRKA